MHTILFLEVQVEQCGLPEKLIVLEDPASTGRCYLFQLYEHTLVSQRQSPSSDRCGLPACLEVCWLQGRTEESMEWMNI